MRLAGAVALAALTLCAARSHAAGEIEDPGCGEFRIVLRADAVIYALPHGFLRAGTDSVSVRGIAWRRGTDYAIDLLRGELRLLRAPAAGDTLVAVACFLLDPPPLVVQRIPYRAPRAAAADTAASDTARATPVLYRPATARDPSRAPDQTSLSLSGNKTLAIDFGSQQDAFLRQSLDLAVSGTLAPGVELTGVLSDRNTPLTAGGSTQDLQSLDRVLIELKAPRGSAALGDVPLAWTEGEFGRLERRLQGVRGEWNFGRFQAIGAAATQQGEFRRLQLIGIEGQQGPYLLTDRDGGSGVPVVAGSDVVTLDGARMTRGESADYAIDYERGRITFTNRRPITAETRIAIDYQIASSRFRRNLAAMGGRFERGAFRGWTRVIQEGDDRGRPLETTLSAEDRLQLTLIGDSASLAVGPGVIGGGGDYDSVRIAGRLVYAFAGPDSGDFAVSFSRAGAGLGDYADSTLIDGRTAFRYVGDGNGGFRIGRALPLPESHQLWTVGGEVRRGVLSANVEGAVTRFDRNTFSGRDDGDNLGGAGRTRVGLEFPTRGTFAGTAGFAFDARAVERRFVPFSPLERPFAEESWGLPVGADLEHQRRGELSGFFRPRAGGELRSVVGRLTTDSGYRSWRNETSWARDGFVMTRAAYERASGKQDGLRFGDGGRERARAELGLRGRWVAPTVRAESDERSSPSDTGRVATRIREAAFDLATGRDVPWRAAASVSLRREANAAPGGFADRNHGRALRVGLDSPAGRKLAVAVSYQRRDVEPVGLGVTTRSDLGSIRARAEHKSGASALGGIEITSEGETRRARELVFVGNGRGAYDAFGNFVGTGDYDLIVSVRAGFDRIARAATSARLALPFGKSERWRGSRLEFDFESDARRRGDLRPGDPWIAPRSVRDDPALARGSVLQRASAELAPGARAASVFVRIERRVTGDRTFTNFAQFVDDRNASARWRARSAVAVGLELELRARRQEARQQLAGNNAYRRVIEEGGGTFRAAYTPGPRLRVAGAAEVTWSRPEGGADLTRLIRVGPDLGLSLGARGRLEAGFRRALSSGPAPLDLLPTADPLATLRWEGNARIDWRVHEGATFGTSITARDRTDRRAQVTGRAELRAFF